MKLSAGFSRVDITPPLGIPIGGYYQLRLAQRILDPLEASALAVSDGGRTVLIYSVDLLELKDAFAAPILDLVARELALPRENLFIACTHTHTGPQLDGDAAPELREEYFSFLKRRLRDAGKLALDDLKPARLGYAVSRAPGISFIRRYRMKDGTIHTNPGIRNPEVVCPVGEVDDAVSVIRFDREGGDSIVIAHFAVHPDTIGGCVISADWPGFARRTLEKTLDGVKCMVLNGAIGDVNHVNTLPEGGALNDLVMDFDDCMRGYGHSRHMGRAVAGAVLQVYGKVAYTDSPSVRAAQTHVVCPSNRPRPEEIPEAERICRLHSSGRDAEIPFTGMQLTTVVAEAERILELKDGPDGFDLLLSAVSIGPVKLIGIPGEPFSQTGRELKAAAKTGLILPCCCVNGYANYFPLANDYLEGGYEARSSLFKAGVAETLRDKGLELLDKLETERD
ncbi:MAG: hypothetical protein K5663_11065 [Clostridiales bacterium]|nr:hypothetical protein [Clostridiales bacterium]